MFGLAIFTPIRSPFNEPTSGNGNVDSHRWALLRSAHDHPKLDMHQLNLTPQLHKVHPVCTIRNKVKRTTRISEDCFPLCRCRLSYATGQNCLCITSWSHLGIDHSTHGPSKILIKMFSAVIPGSYSVKLRATNMVEFAPFSAVNSSPRSTPPECWVKATPWRLCHQLSKTCCIFLDA